MTMRHLAALLIILLIAGCEQKTTTEPKNISERAEQFIRDFEQLRGKEDQRKIYLENLSLLTKAVGREVKNHPEMMAGFLQEMVDIAANSNPGLSLQVENYANEAVRKEMERLRQDSNVSNLLEKEKIISQLQSELAAAKNANAEQGDKIKELEKVIAIINSKVPVLLQNTWMSTLAIFKITSDASGKIFTYTVDDAEGPSGNNPGHLGKLEITLEPGDYLVDICDGPRVYAKSNYTVGIKPVQEKYHLVITTPD